MILFFKCYRPWFLNLTLTIEQGFFMWFKIHAHEVTLQIIAKPHAKKTALVAITEQGLHIALHAKPHQNAANKELISFLAKLLMVPKSSITLKMGARSKQKWVVLPLTDIIQDILLEPSRLMKNQ